MSTPAGSRSTPSLQTGNIHPIAHLEELDKVRSQARAAGNPVGALVLRNKHGRGVAAFDEADYALLITRLVRGVCCRQPAVATQRELMAAAAKRLQRGRWRS